MKRLLLTVACAGLIQALWADIVPGKAYRLVPGTDSGKSVLVENSAFDNGKKAVVWTETDVPSQQWVAAVNGDKLTLRNVYTGKYLTASSAVVQQGDNAAAATAQWTVDAIDAAANKYRLKQASGTVVRYLSAASATDGTQLTLSAEKTGTDAAQQTWTLVEVMPIEDFTPALRDEMIQKYLDAHLQTVSGGKTFTKGGWGEAETLETILDAYETTGNAQYLSAFSSVYSYFKKMVGSDFCHLVYEDAYKWYGHDFNDDVMWMIIAAARAYHLTGNKTYLNDAKKNFDAIYKRAYNQWGMLRWAEQSGGKNGTNSCINGPAEVAACYIALGTGDESYFEKARDLYDHQRRYLFNAYSGAVYDSFTWNADTNLPGGYNYWSSTYNQGTMLGAAAMLYLKYGDEQYRQDAAHIVQYTVKNLCNAYGVVSACQTVEGDLCGFKGILMRYMRKYAEQFEDNDVAQWLKKNAMAAYCNRNSKGITSSAWLTKAAEDGTFGDKTYTGQAFGNSTAVSAAANALLPASGMVIDPWNTIQAEDFDAFQGTTVAQVDGRTVLTSISKGKWAGYYRVDFGSTPAQRIELTLSKMASKVVGGSVEVCLDSPKATPIATVDAPADDEWATVSADLPPVAGMHDVYLRFKTKVTSSVNAFHLDSFRFLTSATPLMQDVTKGGGQITVLPEVQQPAAAIDANPVTAVEVQGHQLTLQYASPVAVRPMAYSLTAGTADAAADPKDWRLLASADGQVWTELDSQTDAAFAARTATVRHDVASDKYFSLFRLEITGNHGAGTTSLADWQLTGLAEEQAGITADGGAFATPGDAASAYTANGAYTLTHYAVTAPQDGTPASAWTMYASADGRTWTAIDHRRAQVFTKPGSTAFYTVSTDTPCSYFRLDTEGEGTVQRLQLFGRLKATAALYHGIFGNGGTFSASSGADAASLKPLADNDVATPARIPFAGGNAWVMYKSQWPFKVKSYSVCAGSTGKGCPKNWKLQVSNDGQNWTTLRSVSNRSFSKRGTVYSNTLSSTSQWQYVRLDVSALDDADAKEMVIDEWQLNGQCLTSEAVTADGGTLTALIPVDKESENADKVADNNISTKYCFSFYPGVWMNYVPAKPAVVNLYSLSSANDNPARDPMAWTLLGSDDGNEWTVLDRREAEAFSDRYVTQFYSFDNTRAYAQYRLQVDGNTGDKLLQLSEWQLLYSEGLASGIGSVDAAGKASGIRIGKASEGQLLHVQMPADGYIYIYSQTGQLAMRTAAKAGHNGISVAALPHGLYVVKAAAGQAQQVEKVIF